MRYILLSLALAACGPADGHPPAPGSLDGYAESAAPEPKSRGVETVVPVPSDVPEESSDQTTEHLDQTTEDVTELAEIPSLFDPVPEGVIVSLRLSIIFILGPQAPGTIVDIKTVGGYLPFVGMGYLTVEWNDVPSQSEIDLLTAQRQRSVLRIRLSGTDPPPGVEILGGYIDPQTGDISVRFFLPDGSLENLETRVQFWASMP